MNKEILEIWKEYLLSVFEEKKLEIFLTTSDKVFFAVSEEFEDKIVDEILSKEKFSEEEAAVLIKNKEKLNLEDEKLKKKYISALLAFSTKKEVKSEILEVINVGKHVWVKYLLNLESYNYKRKIFSKFDFQAELISEYFINKIKDVEWKMDSIWVSTNPLTIKCFDNYILFKERWFLKDETNLCLFKDFSNINTGILVKKLNLIEKIWVIKIEDIYEMKYTFIYSKLENLEFFIEELWINNGMDIDFLHLILCKNSLREIKRLIDYITDFLWVTDFIWEYFVENYRVLTDEMIEFWMLNEGGYITLSFFYKYLLFKGKGFIKEDEELVFLKDFWEMDTGKLEQKLDLFKSIWITKIGDIYEVKYSFIHSDLDNLKFFIEELRINKKEDLAKMYWILYRWDLKKMREFANFLESEFWKENIKKTFLGLIYNVYDEKFDILHEKLKIFRLVWIEDIEKIIEYGEVLWNINMETLKFIYYTKNLSKEKKMYLLLQNSNIKSEKYLVSWRFNYKKDRFSETFKFFSKYRKEFLGNPYVDDKTQPPFSLVDVNVDKSLSWRQKKWKHVDLWDRKFFHINNDKWVSNSKQKMLTDMLWNIFPMTRILRLINWKTEYVSVDIDYEEWKQICWYKEDTLEEIINFLRMIYQFISLDSDRDKLKKRNITDDNIIFDFDTYGFWKFYCPEGEEFADSIFEKVELFNEFKQIFYLIKNYVYLYSIDEIKRYEREKINTYNYKKRKEIEWKIESLRVILNREQQFTMTNLVSSLWIEDEEILDFAFKSDSEMFS